MKHCLRLLLPGWALGGGVGHAQAPTPPPLAHVTLSSYMRDRATGENLIGVAVVQAGTNELAGPPTW